MQQKDLHPPPLSEAEKLDWLRLSRTENVGPITFYRLVEFYGSPAKALENLPELARRGGKKSAHRLPEITEIEKEYASLCNIKGAGLVTAACEAYPLALSALDDAPPVLSYIGNPDLMNTSCIGIVGARNASMNGRKFTEKLARELGQKNQIIVSGLARGIDTAAHKGALGTGTISVVAGGIDIVYPEENIGLYEEIKEHGLIIAESPMGQKPFAQSFPRRNRIVSGISKGVIVVEATMRSGSLITARLAGEQGRDVMAVPGSPLDPRAAGPNHLIREGATLIRSADDVLEGLLDMSGNMMIRETRSANDSYEFDFVDPEDVPENAADTVLQNLSFTPLPVDELIRACDMSVGNAQTVLLELELAGRIKRHPGNRVSLIGK